MDAEAFAAWWAIDGEWVEPPNQRRNGWSGMARVHGEDGVLYVKRQLNHRCRTLSRPFGWPTVSREYHYILRLRQLGVTVPEPVFHGVRNGDDGVEAVLVTRELEGFLPLSDFLALDDEGKHRLAEQIGLMLGTVHAQRFQHSSLYDKHVMIRAAAGGEFQPALIDLEKMRVRLTRRQAAGHDLEQLQRRQKVFDTVQWRALLTAHARNFKVCS